VAKLPFRRQGSGRAGALMAVLGGLAFMLGCDASEDADLVRGRALFLQNCGTCHTLAEAGTSAQVGPDLDASFAQARGDGMDSDTVEGVVQQQIAHPRVTDEGVPNYTGVYMPADLVTGQDAEDVATYVASVAGVPGAKPPPLGTPAELFTEKCGSCHSLEAGTGDGTGPNLGDSLAGKDAKYIEKQIVDPNSEIAAGFSEGVMPPDFGQQIPEQDLQGLVQYILDQVQQGG
jgi:mono/diheme cytochrome c family protein